MADYVTSKVEWKYEMQISEVLELVIDAVQIIGDTYKETDLLLLKQYILDKAEELCEEQGIYVDDEFTHMLSITIDYVLV